MKVESPSTAELKKVDSNAIIIPAEGFVKGVHFVRIPEKDITNARTVVVIGVYHNNKKIETVKVKFIGPVNKASDAKRN
jgi:hypothetical protein